MVNRRVPIGIVMLAVVLMAASQAAAQMISVAELAVCRNVVDRMPVGSDDVFPAGTPRLFCFSRILGVQGATSITHNWYYQGSLKASVALPVRNDNWRTWSSKTLLPGWTGEWMVEVLTEDGRPLDSVVFFIQ